MIRIALVLLLLVGAPGLASSAQNDSLTFYVQLVRGTDDVAPPSREARLVGPELGKRLQVFKWKNYWEMGRRTIVLKPGGETRQRMTPHRDIDIALTSAQEMTVSIYVDGKLSRRRTQPADTAFYIAGGDHDKAQCWFIVVRRDKPQIADVSVK
jgi:hypothetical protein